MNFYYYLKNKVSLFENETNVNYYYDGVKFYPILNNTFYFIKDNNKGFNQITKTATNPKIKKEGIYLIKSGKSEDIFCLEKVSEENKTDKIRNEKRKKKILDNIKKIKYIEIDDIYYPIFQYSITEEDPKKYVYIIDDNINEINLDDYQMKKSSISNYYIKLSSKNTSSGSSSGGSSGVSDELPEETPTEEPPPEETK
jgi:hypothetical protein